MLFRILLCIADEQIAIDILDAKRRIAGRDVGIGESAADYIGGRQKFVARGTVGGQNVDSSVVKVRSEKKYAFGIGANHKAFIDGGRRSECKDRVVGGQRRGEV